MILFRTRREFERVKVKKGHLELHTADGKMDLEYNQELPLRFRFLDRRKSDIAVTVTSRDLEHPRATAYHPDLVDIANNPDPNKTYLEVGAGLGELTKIPGIIVVDMADYPLMLRMLHDLGPDVKKQDRSRYEEIVARCERVLDPQQVTLITGTLHDVVNKRYELWGVADVVVDNRGAFQWTDVMRKEGEPFIFFEDVLDMESKFLKEGGLLYYNEELVYQRQGHKMVPIR